MDELQYAGSREARLMDEMGGSRSPFLGETTYRLFARWREGEAEALDQLCRRYDEALRRFFHLRLPRGSRGLQDTRDLVQETLSRTVQKLDGFDYSKPHALTGYLFAAARNRLRDEYEKAGRRPGIEDLAAEPEDLRPSPLEELVGKERVALYELALASLRGRDRDLIFHRVELGLSWAEIAGSLEMSTPDAARVATGRAVVRLAEAIRRQARDRGPRL